MIGYIAPSRASKIPTKALSPHSHQALRDRAEIFDLVRVTPRGLDRLFVENIRNWECSVSDTARNFLIGCAETAPTGWTNEDQGIWVGSMRPGRSPKAERRARP
jgi:hypothetical protein